MIAEAGNLERQGKVYQKVQILSVPDILRGWRFNTPGVVGRNGTQPVLQLAPESPAELPLIGGHVAA